MGPHSCHNRRRACEGIGAKDGIKRSVPPQQLRCAFRSDAGRARQFIRRVTAERDKVRHLLWIDAISLPDLFGLNARNLSAPRWVKDGRGR
jgi:hypothetical protein